VPALTRDEVLRLRCSDEDWRVWLARAKTDSVWRATDVHRRRVDRARQALLDFVEGERGYIGISWGKDSTALLSLLVETECDWPLVHIVIEPVQNPDCAPLRDAWFALYPALRERYYEVRVRCQPKPSTNRYDTNLAYKVGFATAARRFGKRYVSGIRAEESGIRKRVVRGLGLGDEDANTGRPLGYWKSEDVFARLLDYPLHSVYPCTLGGAYDRGRVRCNNLWGLYAEEFGRREHEWRYYRDDIKRIEAQHARDVAEPPSFDACVPRLIYPVTA
jgi:phosphoadenosine phosphosulfate reductase